MTTEKDCLTHLKTFENISQKKIDSLNQRLNSMKTQIQSLNEYFSSTYQQHPSPNEAIFQFKEMESQIASFLSNERNENIDIINQNFTEITNHYMSTMNNPSNEKEKYFEELNSLQNQINEMMKEIVNKADTAKSEREHTQINIIDGINAEFNKIFKQQVYEEKRTEYINSIQNMLLEFAAKFKGQQKEKREFEENVVALLEELCMKITEMHKHNAANAISSSVVNQ